MASRGSIHPCPKVEERGARIFAGLGPSGLEWMLIVFGGWRENQGHIKSFDFLMEALCHSSDVIILFSVE